MDRNRFRMPASTSLLLNGNEDSLHVRVTRSDDFPQKHGGRSSWHPLGRPSQHAPRARTRISITFSHLILYALICVAGIFALIMAQSGKSRNRNTHTNICLSRRQAPSGVHSFQYWGSRCCQCQTFQTVKCFMRTAYRADISLSA